MPTIVWILIALVAAVAGGGIGYKYRQDITEKKIDRTEEYAKRLYDDAVKKAEDYKKEKILEAKEEILKAKAESDRERAESEIRDILSRAKYQGSPKLETAAKEIEDTWPLYRQAYEAGEPVARDVRAADLGAEARMDE